MRFGPAKTCQREFAEVIREDEQNLRLADEVCSCVYKLTKITHVPVTGKREVK